MSVVETLGSPVVQLFLDYKYSGSGVLVEVDDVSGILTAEHVIFNRDRFKKAQVLSTIPRFYSVDSFDDPIIDDPATQASATHIRIDLLRWYPLPLRTEKTMRNKVLNGVRISALFAYRKAQILRVTSAL